MNMLNLAKKNISMLPIEYKNLSVSEMRDRVLTIKELMGKQLYIPGHHYQKDEVIEFADETGDSLQLAQAAANTSAKYIVFCGVHFMAETADLLTSAGQVVTLPDLRAGCSMADMANIYQTERAWEQLQKSFGDTILPLTYVNSTASIKGFCGAHGGATVTSSNAHKMVQWAFTQKERILFLPDQHLGRNTAYDLGVALNEMAVWDPLLNKLDYDGDIAKIKVILWKGHCSVHEKFTIENIAAVRSSKPEMKIIVHPECTWEVVQKSDCSGSTKKIIETIASAPAGSQWAVGTEMNLVKRIIKMHPDKTIISLNPNMCPCLTMNRINLPYLLWSLESVASNKVVNRITVADDVAHNALAALERMLTRA